ncbi:MAG: elongation factor G [Planctomycetes bacterium]|nr:elongation factor G [Planctomycetota bacterium]
MAHRPEEIRNVVLFGQTDSGKTGLVDALALVAKVTQRHGNSADGTSISNTEPEEKERKHTLSSHLFHFQLDKVLVHVADTPGHTDFLADTISAMRMAEIGFLCVNAHVGLSFHGRRLWKEAGRSGIGRAVLVSHLDTDTADFDRVCAQLVEAMGDCVVPVTYPDQSGHGLGKVFDVLAGEGPKAAEYRARLEEHVAEVDDDLLAKYLDQGALTRQELEQNLSRAISLGKLVPVFAVCPPKMIGIPQLIHYLVAELPSPLAYGARNAAKPGSESYDQLVEPDPNGPFAAQVFKVVVDPYVGRMAYLRCLRGHLKAEEGFLNVRTGKHDKVGGLLKVQAKDAKPMDMVVAGDVFAVGKLEDLTMWDTVTADAHPLVFPKPQYPVAVYSLAVRPKARGDETKIAHGLEKLAAEDPTFHVSRDPNTGELVVSGNSPLHIEINLQRLLKRYGVATEYHLPVVPYREAILAKAEGHHRHKKQTGGRGQFAEVYLRVAPRERGQGFEYVDSVVGGSIPRQFIPEVEKGIRKFLEKGGLAGFPVVDVTAEVYDGKFHDVDSDQISFQIAGERAFADAFTKARPVLLEPIMEVEIQVPERFTGDVAGNLSTIRGRMSGMEAAEGIQVIRAQVPLKEMLDYSTHLRSITAGEGTFTMRPSHYEQVPGNLQADIVARHKKAAEEAHNQGHH